MPIETAFKSLRLLSPFLPVLSGCRTFRQCIAVARQQGAVSPATELHRLGRKCQGPYGLALAVRLLRQDEVPRGLV